MSKCSAQSKIMPVQESRAAAFNIPKNVSRQNIRCLRILSHTASKQGFYRDCSPGPTDLNPSQVAILAHKHWVGAAFFYSGSMFLSLL